MYKIMYKDIFTHGYVSIYWFKKPKQQEYKATLFRFKFFANFVKFILKVNEHGFKTFYVVKNV